MIVGAYAGQAIVYIPCGNISVSGMEVMYRVHADGEAHVDIQGVCTPWN